MIADDDKDNLEVDSESEIASRAAWYQILESTFESSSISNGQYSSI